MDVGDVLPVIVLFLVIVVVSIYLIGDSELRTSDEYLKGMEDGYEEYNFTKLEFCGEYKGTVTTPLRNSDDYEKVTYNMRYCSGYSDGYEKRRIEELTKGINGE